LAIANAVSGTDDGLDSLTIITEQVYDGKDTYSGRVNPHSGFIAV
jgi:hypothetical protein